MNFIGINTLDELIKTAQEDLYEVTQEFLDHLDILENTLDGEASMRRGYPATFYNPSEEPTLLYAKGGVDATTYISRDNLFTELFEYDSIENIIKIIYKKSLEKSDTVLRNIYSSIIETISDNNHTFDSPILRDHMPFKFMGMVLEEIKKVDIQDSNGINIPAISIKMHFYCEYES